MCQNLNIVVIHIMQLYLSPSPLQLMFQNKKDCWYNTCTIPQFTHMWEIIMNQDLTERMKRLSFITSDHVGIFSLGMSYHRINLIKMYVVNTYKTGKGFYKLNCISLGLMVTVPVLPLCRLIKTADKTTCFSKIPRSSLTLCVHF